MRKAWAEQNKDRRAELQRERRRDPDIYQAELDANAAARRLKRQLERAGLPPKRLHPVTAAERRKHEREAAAYFGDPGLSEHVRQFSVFTATLTEHMLEHGKQMREFAEAYATRRARMGLPAVDAEQIMYARAVEIVTRRVRRIDLLTIRDVAVAVRSTDAVVRQEEWSHQYEQFVKALVAHVERYGARLTDEAAFENRARQQHGRPSSPLDSLVIQLATQQVLPALTTSRLSVHDARRAGRAAKARIVTSIDEAMRTGVDRGRTAHQLRL